MPASEFNSLFTDGVEYVGRHNIDAPKHSASVVRVMEALTKPSSSAYVKPHAYVPVTLAVDLLYVELTDKLTNATVLSTHLRETAYCCRGPSSTPFKVYIALVTTDFIGEMVVGYVCHVLRASSQELATSVVNALGRAFRAVQEADRFSHRSSESHDSFLSVSSSSRASRGQSQSEHSSQLAVPLTAQDIVEEGKTVTRHRRSVSDASTRAMPLVAEAKRLHVKLHAESTDVIQNHSGETGVVHRSCFTGKAIVDWLMKADEFASEQAAMIFMQELLQQQLLVSLDDVETTGSMAFTDNDKLYRFAFDDVMRRRRSRQHSWHVEHTALVETPLEGVSDACVVQFTDLLDSSDTLVRQLLDAINLGDEAGFAAALDGASKPLPSPPQLIALLLYFASLQESTSMYAQLLLDAGVDVNVPLNKDGNTPLHMAALSNQRYAALFLLDHGADVNVVNASKSTPLLLASSKDENHECSIALLERGAFVRCVNTDGKRPIDNQPFLAEAQRLFCQNIGDSLGAGLRQRESLEMLAGLSINPETHPLLCDALAKPNNFKGLFDYCDKHQEAQQLIITYITNATRTSTSNMFDADFLRTLVLLLKLKGRIAQVCVAELAAVLDSAQHPGEADNLPVLASLDLPTLLELALDPSFHKDVSIRMTLFEILALVSRISKAAKRLVCPALPRLVTRITQTAASQDIGPDSTTASELSLMTHLLSNLMLDQEAAQVVSSQAVISTLVDLLQCPVYLVRIYATRCLVLLGHPEPGELELLGTGIVDKQHPEREVLELSEAADVDLPFKGATLEIVLGWLFDGDIPADRVALYLTVLSELYTLGSLLRLLLHRFYTATASHVSDQLEPEHERLFGVLNEWVSFSQDSFSSCPQATADLEHFEEELVRRHMAPVYLTKVASLRHALTTPKQPPEYLTDFKTAPHELLYEEACHKVVSSEVPVPLDMAITMAAAQIHIEDMVRRRMDLHEQVSADAKVPSYRLKSVIPAQFLKDNRSELPGRIASEYHKLKHRSIRDAKHHYLYWFKMSAGQDFIYFPVKLVDQQHKLACIVGVSPQRVLVINDKTKLLISQHSILALRGMKRVPEPFKTKSRLSFSGSRHACVLLEFATTKFVVCGDEKTLQAMSSRIQHNLTHHPRARQKQPHTKAHAQGQGQQSQAQLTQSALDSLQLQATATAHSATASPQAHHAYQDTSLGSIGELNPSFDDTSEMDMDMFAPAAEPSRLRSQSLALPRRRSQEATPTASPSTSRLGSPTPSSHGASPEPRKRLLSQSFRRSKGKKPPKQVAFECQCPPNPLLIPTMNLAKFTAYDLLSSPRELARQMTLIDHRLFVAIQPTDVLQRLRTANASAASFDARATEAQDPVTKCITWFNQVTQWIQLLLLSEKSTERRCWIVAQLLLCAEECRELCNYNSVMAIVSALGAAPIRRLGETWSMLPQNVHELYTHLDCEVMQATKNFGAYRGILANLSSPAVPYFGMLLRDLTFTHLGNPHFCRNGLLNVYKLSQIVRLIGGMCELQRGSYNIIQIGQVQHFLETVETRKEDELFRMSQQVQPSRSTTTRGSSSSTLKRVYSFTRKSSHHNLSFLRP
eukprot:m.361306 g.361306  ORF g.361306 m.361306 type:complete len:1591 (+) comp19481_c0_seq1:406-5178(+)